jgi:tetratricopeptide (TPR) repeat protein
LRRYEQLRELLEAELGFEPTPAAQRLYEEVRAGQTAEPELAAELWERVGELRVIAGDTNGAVKAFSLALDAADAPGIEGRLHRRAAQALLMQHDAEQADAHLHAAEQLSADPAERARLVCLRANQAWERGDLDRAQALAEWARDLAQSVGDPDDLAAAQEALAIVSHMRGDWRRGLAIEIERVRGDDAGAPPARVFTASASTTSTAMVSPTASRNARGASLRCPSAARPYLHRLSPGACSANRCCTRAGTRPPAVSSGVATCTRRS